MITRVSRAKINWFLHVGPLRADGYHDIQTLFQELAYADKLTFIYASEDRCDLKGFDLAIAPENNLVYRAWKQLKARFPEQVQGVDIKVDKILPMGGGLGGGSSNAATALVALNELFSLRLAPHTLRDIGSEIGSDVPFFIEGGLALATGRGEKLEQFKPCPIYWLCLYIPHEPMSTAEGYRLLDECPRVSPTHAEISLFLTALRSGSAEDVATAFLPNDFELVAQNFPWFTTAAQKLEAAGALKVFLCGSGSSVAALARDEQHALKMAAQVGGICTSTTVR